MAFISFLLIEKLSSIEICVIINVFVENSGPVLQLRGLLVVYIGLYVNVQRVAVRMRPGGGCWN